MKKRILILALSGIGDALMFTPALRILRDRFPDAVIDALVMFKGSAVIYERLPEINDVLHFDFLNAGALKGIRFILSLRKKYDITVNVYPSNRKEYNIINFILGARIRAGVRYLRNDFFNLGFLNNVFVREDDALHNAEENITLIDEITKRKTTEIPPLNFPLKKEEEIFADNFLRMTNISENDIVIGFHPGCNTLKNHINRRWPPEKFSLLAEKLIANFDAKILVFGGPEESKLKNETLAGINSPKAAIVNTKSLAESAAVMKRCNVFVTNDSSLMHIASSLRLKTVAIIGPTNVSYIHPWKTEYKIASLNLECSPCFFYSPAPLACSRNDIKYKCIRELSAERVFNLTAQLIKTNF